MTRTSTRTHSISGPLKLADMRWLVQECVGMPDDSIVTVKEHKSYSQMDWDPASITVTGPVAQPVALRAVS